MDKEGIIKIINIILMIIYFFKIPLYADNINKGINFKFINYIKKYILILIIHLNKFFIILF
jgi:hypothetical protein